MGDSPTTSYRGDDAAELPSKWVESLKVTVPGYRLRREIARGGQAIVYLAEKWQSDVPQVAPGPPVAIKVLREGSNADERARERLRREWRALAVLDHPNIVKVIDIGRTGQGNEFLVMEYISGSRLDEYLFKSAAPNRKPVRIRESLQIFLKICDAMAAAHHTGIVHRDLSPSNILIDERREPRILDFGLARTRFDHFMQHRTGRMTETGEFVGKLRYASPEQALGNRRTVDSRTDVYALGMILYRMLTGGEFPYAVVGTTSEVVRNIISSPPLPPSLQRGRQASSHRFRLPWHTHAVDPIIEAIVMKALEKDPENRYRSASELCEDVGHYLDRRPTRAGAEAVRRPNSEGPSNWALVVAFLLLLVVLFWTARVWLVRPLPIGPSDSRRPVGRSP